MKEYSREQIESWTPGGTIETDGDDVLVFGPLGSGTMWVDINDKSITPHLMKEPFWESWITSWHTKNLENYKTYIDIGANSGYYSLLAKFYGLDVIAIEANPRYVHLLKRTFANEISVIPAAVSDKKGKVSLDIPPELHGSASIRFLSEDHQVEKVKAITLNELDDVERPLVKMDIEGAEEMAFNGGMEWLDDNKADLILEYTPRAYSDDFYDELSEYGEIKMVNFVGDEEEITKQQVNAHSDWLTMIVRHHG